MLKRKGNGLKPEDAELLLSLEGVRRNLDFAHKAFDSTLDSALVDSVSYEIMALNKRYDYYIKRCKERGLVADLQAAKPNRSRVSGVF